MSGSLSVETPKVSLGGMLKFAVSLDAKANQKWMIDYAVHHVKANGRTTAKVFKWTTRTVDKGDSLTLERNHVMKPISTRRYYSGTHAVEVFVNGVSVGRESFEFDAD